MATNGPTLHDIEMFGSDEEGGAAAAARVDSDQDMEGLFGDEDNEQRKDDISLVSHRQYASRSQQSNISILV